MIDLRAVRRYSQALFELAVQSNQLDKIDDQLVALCKLVADHHEINHLVSNSTIALAEKEDFLGKIVSQDTLSLLLNFLKVLVKKRRFKELPSIQKEFHRLYEKNRKIEEVRVVTAVPLSPANAAKLEKVLGQKLKSDITLISETDPNMIGGIILRYGGQEINASFRARLENLHQLLTA
jgi:F-type H+-transporting ATPase subunit delta